MTRTIFSELERHLIKEIDNCISKGVAFNPKSFSAKHGVTPGAITHSMTKLKTLGVFVVGCQYQKSETHDQLVQIENHLEKINKIESLKQKTISETEQAMLEEIIKQTTVTADDLVSALGLGQTQVYACLKTLKAKGLVAKQKKNYTLLMVIHNRRHHSTDVEIYTKLTRLLTRFFTCYPEYCRNKLSHIQRISSKKPVLTLVNHGEKCA